MSTIFSMLLMSLLQYHVYLLYINDTEKYSDFCRECLSITLLFFNHCSIWLFTELQAKPSYHGFLGNINRFLSISLQLSDVYPIFATATAPMQQLLKYCSNDLKGTYHENSVKVTARLVLAARQGILIFF